MKKIIINIMSTTGLSLIILAIIGTIYGADFLLINSVFQSLGANIIIHLGFLLTRKFESEYVALETLLDILYTTLVLIIFGEIFDWFNTTPKWILAIMAVVIHLIVLPLNMVRMREEANSINKLLKKRNRKINHGGSENENYYDSGKY